MIYEKDGKSINVILVDKPIKHAYFHFKPGYLEVTKSKKISMAMIHHYLDKNFDKLYHKINHSHNLPTYFGQNLDFKFIKSEQFYYEINDQITIYHNEKSDDLALIKFYQHETKKRIETLTPWLIDRLNIIGLKPLKTEVKWLKSKYGSCHTKKRLITINAFLAKLDVIYLKYVLLHEYAHILVPNHQKPFYLVLDQVMPNHRPIQKALKKHHL